MDILLGIFWTETFTHVHRQGNIQIYPFYDNPPIVSVMEEVEFACRDAEKISFVLDGLYLPLSDNSYSCKELKMILKEGFVGKVQFWLNKQKIPTEKVIDLIRKVKEEKLTFDHINFNYESDRDADRQEGEDNDQYEGRSRAGNCKH